MIEIFQSDTFRLWRAGLQDQVAARAVDARIRRISLGNFGDVKPTRGALSELRIDHGPGYRIYLMRRGRSIVILLAAGTKRTQSSDIARAQKIAVEWESMK